MLQVHPGRVATYLRDLGQTLVKAGQQARGLLREDIERIVIHAVRPLETTKPFARAEVVATGKGLLERAAFMVAGAGFAECYTAPTTYWIDLV